MKSNRWVAIQVCVLMLFLLAACSSVATPDPNALKPSKPGGTGEALKFTGDPARGKTVFSSQCRECHGEEGASGRKGAGENPHPGKHYSTFESIEFGPTAPDLLFVT